MFLWNPVVRCAKQSVDTTASCVEGVLIPMVSVMDIDLL